MIAHYFAGLFDGEGCVHISNQHYSLSVIITMCHKPTIELLNSSFPGCMRMRKPKNNRTRIAWCWSVQSDKALKFLKQIEPYVITKKEEVLLAIEAQEKRHTFPMIGKKGIGQGRRGTSKGEEYKQTMGEYRERLQQLKKREWR